MTVPPPHASTGPHTRSMFIRDLLGLQLKLLLLNLHNFVLIPLTIAAAALDLVFKSGGHGSRFYRVLNWGRQSEEAIGLYRALDNLRPEETAGEPQAPAPATPLISPPVEDLS